MIRMELVLAEGPEGCLWLEPLIVAQGAGAAGGACVGNIQGAASPVRGLASFGVGRAWLGCGRLGGPGPNVSCPISLLRLILVHVQLEWSHCPRETVLMHVRKVRRLSPCWKAWCRGAGWVQSPFVLFLGTEMIRRGRMVRLAQPNFNCYKCLKDLQNGLQCFISHLLNMFFPWR